MPNLRGKTWTPTTPATVADAQNWEEHLISNEDYQKVLSAVQRVNNTLPDEYGNVHLNTLPDGGLPGQIITKLSAAAGDAGWENPPNLAHIIEKPDGIGLPYRQNLQFINASVHNEDDRTVVDCHGEKGEDGKSAYEYAVDGGYTGTEEQFYSDLGRFQEYADMAEESAGDAQNAVDTILDILSVPEFSIDFTTGEVIYTQDQTYNFTINITTGNLEWEVI